MPSAPDPAFAARRVAEHLRGDSRPHHEDLLALLPVLDAVARGAEGDRVERMALTIAAAGGSTAANGEVFVDVQRAARAALALADAEAAANPWRPIAAVPRDGSRVVVATYDDGGQHFQDARWTYHTTYWRTYADGKQAGLRVDSWPTHWIPEPSVPSDAEQGAAVGACRAVVARPSTRP